MTRKEITKEAEKQVNYCTPYHVGSFIQGYVAGAESREKRIEELEAENERIKTKYYELQEALKKVRLALIKERTANIMNYGKGGVEMFDDCFEILKGVSN